MKIYFYSIFFFIVLTAFSKGNDKIFEEDDIESFKQKKWEISEANLFKSVDFNALKITDYLLSKGVDVNAYDENGSTALIKAVTNGNVELVDVLLTHDADVNQHQKSGLKATALMYSGYSNNRQIIEKLIAKGASINDVDINNDPAINWASYYGNTEAIRAMIDNGADLTIKSKHGLPVDVVYRLWHADSVAKVFREASYGASLTKNEKAIVGAVRNQDYNKTDKLIGKGVSPNTKDQLAIPLIHIASENGDLKMLKLLTSNGAKLSELNRVGQSALAVAARFGHLDLVKLMIDQGADPNQAGDEYRLTPLIGAAINGSTEIGLSLLEAGANPNAFDVVNEAPALHWSMMYQNEDFALQLLGNGASIDQTSVNGQYDAMMLASGYQLSRVVEKINQMKNPLLGSWLISEIHYIYPDTTYKAKMQMAGRFMVSDSTYSIMYNPYGNIRKSPEDMSKMTDQEKLYSFQTVVFNSGSYQLIGNDIVTTADIAKVAGFEGGIQYYSIENSENETSITMYDETYPSGKKPEWYGKVKTKILLKRED